MPSVFNKDTIREYFEYCQRTGKKRVGSVTGLTEHAYKTGNNDEEIMAWRSPGADPTVQCPMCGGEGRVSAPAPAVEPPYPICGGRQETERMNFETGQDELVPCRCATGARPAEETEGVEEARAAAQRNGARMLSRMLSVSEVAIPFPYSVGNMARGAEPSGEALSVNSKRGAGAPSRAA